MPGVWKVSVSYSKEEARVEYDSKRCTTYDMDTALAQIGYTGGLKSE